MRSAARWGTPSSATSLRRRMRAIVAEQAADLPIGAYVVRSCDRTARTLEFDELKVAMSRALEKATSRTPSRTGR